VSNLPSSLTAKDVMDSNVVMMDASASVNEAIKKMVSLDTWSILVEKNGLPAGVLTERDIFRRCLGIGNSADKMKVEEIMSSPIVSVSPGDRIGTVMETMVQKNIRRVFVIENGKVIGRITQTKLFDDAVNLMESLSSLRYQM